MRETGFSTTAPLQLESSSVPAAGSAPAAASGAVAASGAAATNPAGGVVSSPADPGALSVLVHAGGFVYMTETAEFPALLRDVRRDSLRLVKDCLSVKKAGDSETDEVRLAKLEEIGCRVLHVFAMELVFHECVLSAFREKVSKRSMISNRSLQCKFSAGCPNAPRDAYFGGRRRTSPRRRAQGLLGMHPRLPSRDLTFPGCQKRKEEEEEHGEKVKKLFPYQAI
jgi:hypothetical protein